MTSPSEFVRTDTMPLELFTIGHSIGHSTHSIDQFLALLGQHHIDVVADIRRFPGSRKFPHFNQESLAPDLQEAGIDYRWIEALGGRRHKSENVQSKNLGLRNESFRNYADYMPTEQFREGVGQLLDESGRKRTAFMCSESVFWRCHRRLVSDHLMMKGIDVKHIMPSGELHLHTLTTGARVKDGEVNYPPPDADQTRFDFE